MAESHNKSTKAPDALLEKIRKQREEIGKLLESALADSVTADSVTEKRGPKKRKLLSFRINIEGIECDGVLPHRIGIRAGVHNVYTVLSVAELFHAFVASLRANTALMQGRIEDSFQYFVKAERLLGAAVALSQVGKVNGVIAQCKAKLSHAKTYTIRARVIDFWRAKIDPKLSASNAANKILEMFPWKDGEEVSHRTVVKWVAQKKKALLPSKRLT